MRTTEPPKDCWLVKYGWSSSKADSSDQKFFTSQEELERWLLESLLVIASSKIDHNHYRWLSQVWLRHNKPPNDVAKISGIYGVWHLESGEWIPHAVKVVPPAVSIERTSDA